MRLSLSAVLLGFGMIVAGCSSPASDPEAGSSPASTPIAEQSQEEAPPTVTSGPTPTPTQTSLSTADAADRYLEIVGPYNTALEDLESAVNGGQPLSMQVKSAEETLRRLKAELRQLKATAWPTDVQPHIDELISTSRQALPHWNDATEAETTDDLVQATLAATEFDGTDIANTIRDLLGIEPYDEAAIP